MATKESADAAAQALNGQEWLGRALGLVIWDPSVYYFSEIPSDIEPAKAAIVLTLGVLASVLGALAPALRAAWMDPVKALRFE